MFLIYICSRNVYFFATFPNLAKVLGANTENMEAPDEIQTSQIQMKVLAWFQWGSSP